ncbi:MAG: hypothetical protein EAX90_14240 [Candidatus Heimdallarchaeota archaeon]|nr:hypothetical protein [Candidatus Heimdallarchaeota archaeon]
MKPISICLVQMGTKGLELVKSYPDVLPIDAINEIVVKSMPLGAKEGDFTSNILKNENAFSGFVFSIPSEVGRDNIASLVAVYENMKYNTSTIRKVFSVIINELKSKKVVSTELISEILPNLFDGLNKGFVKIQISSIVTVEVNISEEEEKDPGKDAANSLANDMWK